MIVTETGAGQWGSALAFACKRFGLRLRVYMVRVSYQQKPGRKNLIESLGAEIFPSPSPETETGRRYLAQDKNHPGSLGIAISEAIENVVASPGATYALGSVLDAVLLHQTVIGLEVKQQLQAIGVQPDLIVGCVGGGSNFAGLAFPFIGDTIKGNRRCRYLAVEPRACPTLTAGELRYDFGDSAALTPLIYMYTLGKDFVPPAIHAGGLRYHGMAPLVSMLVRDGIVEPQAVDQQEVFRAGKLFYQLEGFLPAPESAHAVAAVINAALESKRRNRRETIVFNLSGHGFLDLGAYSGNGEQYEQLKDFNSQRQTV
jgi:tryptophan synthase beta chain